MHIVLMVLQMSMIVKVPENFLVQMFNKFAIKEINLLPVHLDMCQIIKIRLFISTKANKFKYRIIGKYLKTLRQFHSQLILDLGSDGQEMISLRKPQSKIREKDSCFSMLLRSSQANILGSLIDPHLLVDNKVI